MQLDMFGKKELDTLYKLTEHGKVQMWRIWTVENTIYTEYGHVDGKKQITSDTIKEIKNRGKRNQRTPEQQAEFEAKATWTKKYEKDYFRSIEDATKIDAKFSKHGAYMPMLAWSYDKYPEKIKFPCYVQRKLDGIRAIAVKKDHEVKIWFRGGKEIKTVEHVIMDLDKVMNNGDILDGELYIHDEEDFETFTGALRADINPNRELLLKVKYNIYDFPRFDKYKETDPYSLRLNAFNSRFISYWDCDRLDIVETILVNNIEEVNEYFDKFLNEGYEGLMLRNVDMHYEQKRSYNLLKKKPENEDEFEIVGYNEGNGGLQGHVGAFICRIGDETFDCKLKGVGVTSKLKYYFENPEDFMGKQMTVIYNGLTKYGTPKNPRGKCIRFDLDD